MTETPIARNIVQIRNRMAEAARRAGRPIDSIQLVAVTKTVEAARIAEAYAAGVRDFGENYVQEAIAKAAQPELDWPDARWHFIGHLQRNKVRDVVGRFRMVQSVDTLALAQEIAQRAHRIGHTVDLLLEVKLDLAEAKFGFAPESVLDAAAQLEAVPGIRCQGLMGMAPFSPDPEQARPHFRRLNTLFMALPEAMRQTLSMGMSGDFEVAIEEGATLVRIGTAIFGARTA